MTRKFILKSLLPYKLDNSLCAVVGDSCKYLTDEGKKCGIGQYMKKGKWQHEQAGVTEIFNKYGEEKVMKKEWLNQKIPPRVRLLMQNYHDNIVLVGYNDNNFIVKNLEDATGFDLKELY